MRTSREGYCLSSSVNKLSISMSETTLSRTASRDWNSSRWSTLLCEMWREKNNTVIYQVRPEVISGMLEVKKKKKYESEEEMDMKL